MLRNTASAILQLRDHLNRDSLDRAIALLAAAKRVDRFAVGCYRAVARDAQDKFPRLGVPSGVCIDPRVQALAAQVLGPGDIAFIVSPSGRQDELLAVADMARKADVALIVDHVEDADLHLPMVSRALHLLMMTSSPSVWRCSAANHSRRRPAARWMSRAWSRGHAPWRRA